MEEQRGQLWLRQQEQKNEWAMTRLKGCWEHVGWPHDEASDADRAILRCVGVRQPVTAANAPHMLARTSSNSYCIKGVRKWIRKELTSALLRNKLFLRFPTNSFSLPGHETTGIKNVLPGELQGPQSLTCPLSGLLLRTLVYIKTEHFHTENLC